MLEEKFIFTGAAKKKIFLTIGTGLILVILGLIFVNLFAHGHGGEHEGHEAGHPYWFLRLIKNVWHNNVFFTGISLIGVFFVAFNLVAWAGWSASIKRIPMAMGSFLPYMGVILLVTFLVFKHDLFHWTHEALYDKNSPEFDEVISGKAPYLNLFFYIFRTVAYFILWTLCWFLLRKYSIQQDIDGDSKWHERSVVLAGGFLVIFGITSSTSAWDWVMSTDPHFYSTMFGWYVFASWFVTGLSVMTLIIISLKEKGYLKVVNENHIHDLATLMFGFSIFWTYIWFSQFLLIYYADIPEEAVYFVDRLKNDVYTPFFFFNLIINFLFPFLLLMTRESKRQFLIVKLLACFIILGHWSDFYIMMTPPILGDMGGFDFWFFFIELGMFMIYAGCFAFVMLSALSKASLVPKHHVFLEESLHHHVY